MANESGIFVGAGERPLLLLPKMANRHGLIAGATGTGKTVTLQTLAEGFSRRGVPVFLADVKGDLAGLSQPGEARPKIAERRAELGLSEPFRAAPVVLWDVFGEQGHPVRATISDMGPLLLSRLLELNETQAGVLDVAFRLADEQGLLLLDLKDLRAVVQHAAANAKALAATHGNVAAASVGAIQRALTRLEAQGAERFFGEPALELDDLMLVDPKGEGAINVLAADKLMQSPRLYATMLLWLLSELFERLPEAGDLEKPKLVFFFDEAHLLFEGAPKALVEKVEQVARLIRSKGVGVFFVTQNPLDVPDEIAAQLGNRVQHALRAFTPRDQKAVRAAAETFRQNPGLDAARAIGELAVGEALVSLLDAEGAPCPVERAKIAPPLSRLGAITAPERAGVLAASPLKGTYDQAVDRESAYERLSAQSATTSGGWRRPSEGRSEAQPAPRRRERGALEEILLGSGRREGIAQATAKSVARSIGGQLGRAIVRGILGSLRR
jgi:DNA helicase HerA-like ATPase